MDSEHAWYLVRSGMEFDIAFGSFDSPMGLRVVANRPQMLGENIISLWEACNNLLQIKEEITKMETGVRPLIIEKMMDLEKSVLVIKSLMERKHDG